MKFKKPFSLLGSYLATGGDEKMIEKLPVLSSTPTSSLEEAIDEFQC